MKQHLDFWGEPLAEGDWVIYCCTRVPSLGQIVKIHTRQVEIKQFNGRVRDLRYEDPTDRRSPKNVIKAQGPNLTAYLLKKVVQR